jgi:nucleotide-binding universal stress UspA family protein
MAAISHVLFPFDFSAQGAQIAPFVTALARGLHATVTLYGVMPPAFESAPDGLGPRIGDDPRGWTRDLQCRLDRALIAELAGVSVARVADHGDPAIRTVRFAETHGVDLIMMATHGVGLFRSLVLGSVTSNVLHEARCPVWTAAHTETQRAGALPSRVLCAVDGTPGTPVLLQWAARFAADCGATLKLLHVVSPITDIPALERERTRQNQYRQSEERRVASMLRDAGVDAPLRAAVGETAVTVAEEARQDNADLVIIGRRALSAPFGRLRTHVFGIIQNSPCPVLSV